MYNLFISHSWSYANHYFDLLSLLKNEPGFQFKDYSVPINDPIHHANNDRQLREAIKAKMAYASCVIVLAGVYSTYSKWINIEIDLAKNGFLFSKPIIAVAPWGAERISSTVKENADTVVRWQSSSIIRAIQDVVH